MQDDFEGLSANNSNLALKGMIGLQAYAYLLEKSNQSGYEQIIETAKQYVSTWEELSFAGDHYDLQYAMNDTWSLKYNLLFQYLLDGSNLFSPQLVEIEEAYYQSKSNQYGLSK